MLKESAEPQQSKEKVEKAIFLKAKRFLDDQAKKLFGIIIKSSAKFEKFDQKKYNTLVENFYKNALTNIDQAKNDMSKFIKGQQKITTILRKIKESIKNELEYQEIIKKIPLEVKGVAHTSMQLMEIKFQEYYATFSNIYKLRTDEKVFPALVITPYYAKWAEAVTAKLLQIKDKDKLVKTYKNFIKGYSDDPLRQELAIIEQNVVKNVIPQFPSDGINYYHNQGTDHSHKAALFNIWANKYVKKISVRYKSSKPRRIALRRQNRKQSTYIENTWNAQMGETVNFPSFVDFPTWIKNDKATVKLFRKYGYKLDNYEE